MEGWITVDDSFFGFLEREQWDGMKWDGGWQERRFYQDFWEMRQEVRNEKEEEQEQEQEQEDERKEGLALMG